MQTSSSGEQPIRYRLSRLSDDDAPRHDSDRALIIVNVIAGDLNQFRLRRTPHHEDDAPVCPHCGGALKQARAQAI